MAKKEKPLEPVVPILDQEERKKEQKGRGSHLIKRTWERSRGAEETFGEADNIYRSVCSYHPVCGPFCHGKKKRKYPP